MNEQLAAIKARREAVTPGVWNVRPDTDLVVRGPHLVAKVLCDDAQATAEFIAAAPADITALLAMVERLTARAEEAEALLAGSPADTLAWALDKREQELREARREVDRLTGELAAANAALAQAQDIAQTALDSFAAANTALAAERDAAKRHAAYIASCVDECGSYRP